MFEISAGMRKGWTLRSELYPPPPAVKALQLFSNHSTPPMPEPMMQPNRDASTAFVSRAASAMACFAATRAKCVYLPFLDTVFPLSPLALGSKFTIPATCAGYSSAHDGRRTRPLFPAHIAR